MRHAISLLYEDQAVFNFWVSLCKILSKMVILLKQLCPVHNICMCFFFLCYSTAYMNYISLGTAVIGVGNNLHLILPEGTFPLPVTSSSSQVTSVLTPISHLPTSYGAVRQMYHLPAVTPMQRYRTTAPVLIPAPPRKPSLTSAFAATLSSPAASTTSQTAVHAGLKVMYAKQHLLCLN